MPSHKPLFSDDQEYIFQRTGQLPAILTARQAAAVLGFREHHVGILVDAALLSPLGARNTDYAFDDATIQALRKDKRALIKMRKAVSDYYSDQNHKRRKTEQIVH